MRALFDTNILIDYLNGVIAAEKEFALYQKKLVSVITYIELMVGAKSSIEEKILKGFLATFQVIELTGLVAQQTITLRQKHSLKIPDAIIYASAQTEGTILVTRNSKDMKPEWPDVRVPYLL